MKRKLARKCGAFAACCLLSTAGLFAQSEVSVPYSETFDDFTAFDAYTVIDANKDGKTWVYDDWDYAVANSRETVADDWLITPPMTLKAGKLYTVSFKAKSTDWLLTETLAMSLGKDKTVEAMTTEVIPETEVGDSEQVLSAEFKVQSDGLYYLGIHNYTAISGNEGAGGVLVDDLKIDFAVVGEAPDAVRELEAVAGAKGAREVTVSFFVPGTTISGEPLLDLKQVDIYRDDVLVKTLIDGLDATAKQYYTDTTVIDGMHVYKVVASNESGEGEAAEVSVFVGKDAPEAPGNVVLKLENGKALLSWTAPSVGANGGYIAPDDLVYSVKRNGDIIADDLTDTFFVDKPELEGEQSLLSYRVCARNSVGESKYVISNKELIGTAYELPFQESFPERSFSHFWESEYSFAGGRWAPIVGGGSVPAQDGDNSMCCITPATVESGDARLTSGKISLKGTENPVLEFYYAYYYQTKDVFNIEVSVDGGELEVVKEIDVYSSETMKKWNKMTIPLGKYKDSEYVRIAFYNQYVRGDQTVLYIDNVRVRDCYDYDLAASISQYSQQMTVGSTYGLTARVVNEGIKDVDGGYMVNLYCDGGKIASLDGKQVESGKKASFSFEVTPTIDMPNTANFYVMTEFAGDTNKSNDKSEEVSVRMNLPKYPAVETLSGVENKGSVDLSWEMPDQKPAPTQATDGFESYESFAIDSVGEWLLVDGDGDFTYGIDGFEFPNNGVPMAFIVMNSKKIGLLTSEDRIAKWGAHSGEHMMAAFAGISEVNDDWLISPLLPGIEQTVSFFVKSVSSQYGLESFEVLYSTTNEEVESFKKIKDQDLISEAPVEWTEVSVELPKNTKYFAIRCTSDDRYALLVDDVTFIAENGSATLQGYNVYRDGEKITSSPVQDTKYTDNGMGDGVHVYKVTAVYDKGESVYSNEVQVSTSIDAVAAVRAQVVGVSHAIEVRQAEGQEITVYAVDGKCVWNGTGRALLRIPAERGFYVVSVGGETCKVMVK